MRSFEACIRGRLVRCEVHASMQTFAELYCERHHLAPAAFARALFWRCLHRRAVPLAPLILMVNPNFFTADYDLILSAGRVTSVRQLCEELDDFNYHPLNHGVVRGWMKIRISGARLCHEVHQLLPYLAAARGGAQRPDAAPS